MDEALAELEKAISAARYDEADRLMKSFDSKPPKLPNGCPQLCWEDGTELSDAAQNWYLTNLLRKSPLHSKTRVVSRDNVLRVDPALSDESCVKFARWIVFQKLGSTMKCAVPHGKEEVVNTLGRLKKSGKMKRRLSQIAGMVGSQAKANIEITIRANAETKITDARNVGSTLAFVRWCHRLNDEMGIVFHNLHPKSYDFMVEKHWPNEDDPSGTTEE